MNEDVGRGSFPFPVLSRMIEGDSVRRVRDCAIIIRKGGS